MTSRTKPRPVAAGFFVRDRQQTILDDRGTSDLSARPRPLMPNFASTWIQQINGVPRLHNNVVAQTLDLKDRAAFEVPSPDLPPGVNFIRDRQGGIGRSDDKIINDDRRCIDLSVLVL